jgi:hypothetical protein
LGSDGDLRTAEAERYLRSVHHIHGTAAGAR